MPNWCSSEVIIYGTKEKVNKCHDFIKNALDNPIDKEASDPTCWLGNIILATGITKKDLEKYECRGWIRYLDDVGKGVGDEWCFQIMSEDAWSPKLDAYKEAIAYIDRGKGELNFVCKAVEQGCEIYYNNDTEGKYYPEKWYVALNGSFDGGDYEYEEQELNTDDEVIALVNKVLRMDWSKGTDIDEIIEAVEEANEEEAENYIHIYKYEG